MKIKVIAVTIVVFMVWWIESALGFNQEDIALHGFVSQGYLKSSDNYYLGNSKDGSFEFNEIGLNFSIPITDGLHFGAQLFSMDLGEFGNNTLLIDWAFLDYAWQDWLGFRAGKIKMPLGLYNLQRDADMLRTAILLPQSVYIQSVRDLMIAFQGADLYGTQGLGAFGYIDYEAFIGTIDVPEDTQYVSDIINRLRYSRPDLGVLIPADILSDLDIHTRHIEGAKLLWNTPLSGLRIGGTILAGKIDTKMGIMTTDTTMNGVYVLSAEYDIRNVTLSIEHVNVDLDIKTTGALEGFLAFPLEKEGFYGAISWEVFDWFALGTSYGEFYPDKNDKNGENIEAGGLPDYFAWQKDITLSVRFNITEYWCFKFETHIIDGLGLADIDANDDDPYENSEQNWLLYAVKTSLSF